MDCVQGWLYTGSPTWETIGVCVCNGLLSTEPGKLIGTKLWDHNGCIRVRRYADECCLAEYVIERHSGLIPGVMFGARSCIMDYPICYELRVISIATAQHMQLFPWPAYSPDMSPIEHVWNLVGRRFARDPRPAASKDELLLRIQALWNSLPQADIQNLFDPMPRRTAAFIAVRGGYTKY
ncbi:transposable element Tc1 transposase [Trichonephila clavipes]|uniref:Transposable element Tc1 transposase n=1 Tax=Trichonephila clavipes TaxID=2585209 RepID=A0A8X6VHH8_TRICX|nr:transposable element Tc1 transposase [Trichonephila clavipes]